MADAQARAHGALGVCCATSGGGMMNLAVGIAESFQASVPALAIVGQTPATPSTVAAHSRNPRALGRTVDALGMWRSMSKFRGAHRRRERFPGQSSATPSWKR
jgi:acetolactate synthase-1/2/3 large subunit